MNRFSVIFKKILSVLLVLAIISTLGYMVYKVFFKKAPEPIVETQEETAAQAEDQKDEAAILSPQSQLHIQKFTVGDFGPDDERMAYKSGSMVLTIPKMNLTKPVLSLDLESETQAAKNSGIGEDSITNLLVQKMNDELNTGIVLFNQAQLPGRENRNVSIAGHRDYKGMEFYDIDKLDDGDKMYLDYNGKRYIYEYTETFVTDENDWSPIAVGPKSVLTLQSCDPPYAAGGIYDRIFVVATLIEIQDSPVDAANDSTK